MATLKKIKKEVEREFSPDEIKRFVAISESVVQKTVLHTVAAMVDSATDKPATAREELRNDILALVTNAGSRPLPVPAGNDDEILIFFAPCKRGWETSVAVPDEHVGAEVYARYEYIRKAVHSYWNSFAAANPEICRRIVELLPNVDWKVQPALPTTSTVFYFDPESPHQMGIICALKRDGQVSPFPAEMR